MPREAISKVWSPRFIWPVLSYGAEVVVEEHDVQVLGFVKSKGAFGSKAFRGGVSRWQKVCFFVCRFYRVRSWKEHPLDLHLPEGFLHTFKQARPIYGRDCVDYDGGGGA